MTDTSFSLVWFRQDLRLADNPALNAATEAGNVLPIYILDDINAAEWAMGAASRVWLHHSLLALDRALGQRLQLFVGDAREVIDQLVNSLPVSAVYWNRCYEPWRIERDAQIKTELNSRAIEAKSFNGSLLWEPWTVTKQDGTPYRVFTPFYRNGCLAAAAPRLPLPPPATDNYHPEPLPGSVPLEQLALLPGQDWHRQMTTHWQIGEAAAVQRLEDFCSSDLGGYRQGRDYPARDSISRLSPHLHFGEVSPNQVWHRVRQESLAQSNDDIEHYSRELVWREFSHHLLYHFPHLPERNFNAKFDAFEWLDNDAGLEAWRAGNTGFPIVDAGMRELWKTGYMHNRVRMIVASFLIKNMLVHWREGENWFWDCLVDADLANNSAGWQWCAGSGADAAPYFRIFNPVLQSEKFDPQGEYLVCHCPELTGLPAKLRHKPWEASSTQLAAAGIRPGIDYPAPMLDLKLTRERALARFKALN
jgi:deoxyribodipyrimidine photo-lyase